MAKVVKALTGEFGIGQDTLELVRHVRSLHRRADRRGENEVPLLPSRPTSRSFQPEMLALLPKDGDRECGWRERSSAAVSFRFDESPIAANLLHCVANVKLTGIEIEIVPAKTKRFALTESQCQRNRNERFQPVTVNRVQELASLFRGQRADSGLTRSWRIDECRNVSRDLALFQCLVEGATSDRPHILNRSG